MEVKSGTRNFRWYPKYFIRIVGLFFLLSIIPVQQGCKTMEIKRAQKRAMKVDDKHEKEAVTINKKLLKRQKNIQTDETKQRIKNSKKRSKKHNKKRQKERKFFLWRLLKI